MHGTIGIPRTDHDGFVAADADAPQAAGILCVSPEGRVLLLHRSPDEENFGGHWGLPGGKAEDGEAPDVAALREMKEETSHEHSGPLKVLNRVRTPKGMIFTTFAAPIDETFAPEMVDGEHTGFTWADLRHLPHPLHPQVEKLLGEHIGAAADMSPEDWDALRTNFVKWTREEEQEPEHTDGQANDMALDRATVRKYDGDDRLHVEITNISKANVCEYLGSEIPDFERLGLQAGRLYRLYRDPAELARGAATFNNLPLLSQHVPVDARDHRPDLVVGSTGTDATFKPPFLQNSLVVWAGEAIKDIESENKKELSSAYRYRADMTRGKTPDGEDYDGVMRDIVGNHVALVKEGRAGPDVVVGDSKLENTTMNRITRTGAAVRSVIALHIAPRLAQDASINLTPILAKLTSKNFAASKPKIIKSINEAARGKLAKDASLEDVTGLLDMLEHVEVGNGDDEIAPEDLPDETMDAEGGGALKEFLKAKLSDEDFNQACSLIGAGATDEDDDEGEKKPPAPPEKDKGAGAEDEDDDKEKKDMVDKPTMDAAIDAAVKAERKRWQAIADAREEVRPYVGALKPAYDSAEGVFQAALGLLGVEDADKITGVPALRAVLKVQTKAGDRARSNSTPTVTMDSAQTESFSKRFPHAAKIKVSA